MAGISWVTAAECRGGSAAAPAVRAESGQEDHI